MVSKLDPGAHLPLELGTVLEGSLLFEGDGTHPMRIPPWPSLGGAHHRNRKLTERMRGSDVWW